MDKKDKQGIYWTRDYYYLKKFENKIGIIYQRNECKSGVFKYKVEFNQNEFGYFYKDDFMLLMRINRYNKYFPANE